MPRANKAGDPSERGDGADDADDDDHDAHHLDGKSQPMPVRAAACATGSNPDIPSMSRVIGTP
jgi:hypothetical protein